MSAVPLFLLFRSECCSLIFAICCLPRRLPHVRYSFLSLLPPSPLLSAARCCLLIPAAVINFVALLCLLARYLCCFVPIVAPLPLPPPPAPSPLCLLLAYICCLTLLLTLSPPHACCRVIFVVLFRLLPPYLCCPTPFAAPFVSVARLYLLPHPPLLIPAAPVNLVPSPCLLSRYFRCSVPTAAPLP